jgi:hypothetical protein
MAVVAVLFIDNKLAPVVVKVPFVNVSLLPIPMVLAALKVTPNVFVLSITTPPVPLKVAGNSTPVVCAEVLLYCNVVEAVYVGRAETVAVPSIDKILLTVTPVVVFVPEPERIRLE